MFKRVVLILLITILHLTLNAGCARRGDEKSQTEPDEVAKGISVKTIEVSSGSINRRITTSGILEGWFDIMLSAETGGRLQSIHIDEGSDVKAGELILTLEHESLKHQFASAEAGLKSAHENLKKVERGARDEELAQVEAQFASAETNYKNASSNYQRMKNLYEKEVITKADLDAAESHYAGAKAAYETALKNWELISKGARDEDREIVRAAYESAKAQRNLLEEQYQKAFFRSPIDGIVAFIFPDKNEMVSPGMPVINIVTLDYLKLSITLSADEARHLEKGQVVDVKPEGFDEAIKCEIANIDIKADPMTGTFGARIQVPNPKRELLPGMTASASISFGRHDDVIVIPLDAVIVRGTCKFVAVAHNNKASIRQVFTGLVEDNSVEIVSGLQIGQLLIVEGHKELTEGDLISVGEAN